jgi:hypothetical protein
MTATAAPMRGPKKILKITPWIVLSTSKCTKMTKCKNASKLKKYNFYFLFFSCAKKWFRTKKAVRTLYIESPHKPHLV